MQPGLRRPSGRRSGSRPRAGAAAGHAWVLWTQHACRWAKPLAWRGLQDGLGRGSKLGRRCACIRPPSQPSPCPGEGAIPACLRPANWPRHSFLRERRSPPGLWDAHEKQIISYCEIHPAMRSSSANDMHRQGSKAQKSEDPFDEAQALFERAAPPSPLQAGAPAWLTPGPLRGSLHHQGRRSGSS